MSKSTAFKPISKEGMEINRQWLEAAENNMPFDTALMTAGLEGTSLAHAEYLHSDKYSDVIAFRLPDPRDGSRLASQRIVDPLVFLLMRLLISYGGKFYIDHANTRAELEADVPYDDYIASESAPRRVLYYVKYQGIGRPERRKDGRSRRAKVNFPLFRIAGGADPGTNNVQINKGDSETRPFNSHYDLRRANLFSVAVKPTRKGRIKKKKTWTTRADALAAARQLFNANRRTAKLAVLPTEYSRMLNRASDLIERDVSAPERRNKPVAEL